MVFGLAEGLGFQFRMIEGLENPYLSGVAPGLLESFCRNLGLTFDVAEFDNDKDAFADLKDHIDRQIPVIVQVDLFLSAIFPVDDAFCRTSPDSGRL